MSVNHTARSGGKLRVIFLIFFNMKVYCVLSSESPHRGDSNEHTQYTIHRNLQLWDFSKGRKNECETAMVNEPSVFEPLMFYCTCICISQRRLKNILFIFFLQGKCKVSCACSQRNENFSHRAPHALLSIDMNRENSDQTARMRRLT